MERLAQPVTVYLDTHIVMWLHDGLVNRLSSEASNLIEEGRLFISPIVELELQYLHEIGRIRPKAGKVLQVLESEIGLQRGEIPFQSVIHFACTLHWTRDPFDRLIVGETLATGGKLITKDSLILKHFPQAIF